MDPGGSRTQPARPAATTGSSAPRADAEGCSEGRSSPGAAPEPHSLELAQQASNLDDIELALLAQQYLASGSFREALALACWPGRPRSRGLRLCEARARFLLGEREAGLSLLAALLCEEPRDGLAAFCLAELSARAGNADAAKPLLRALISHTPDFPGALPLLAQLEMPGPAYREVLRRLHSWLAPRVYLEIGVESGATLTLARSSHTVIGVDAVERPLAHPPPAGAQLFYETSDAFFARCEQQDVFGGASVDFCFIDGMHWFEFALRDFLNAERWCSKQSLIALHDCLAVEPVAALRRRRTSFWVGDTWRAVDWLLTHRPDLQVWVVPCYPSGLVLIGNLDPAAERDLAAPGLAATGMEGPAAPGPREWAARYHLIHNSEAALTRWFESWAAGREQRQP